jgi:hypothetical protein
LRAVNAPLRKAKEPRIEAANEGVRDGSTLSSSEILPESLSLIFALARTTGPLNREPGAG